FGQTREYPAPQIETGVGNLPKLVERAEDHRSGALRMRNLHDGQLEERRVAPLAERHAEETFRVQMLGFADGIREAVADPVVHRGQPRSIEIAQPGCLHGCRLADEDAEAM